MQVCAFTSASIWIALICNRSLQIQASNMWKETWRCYSIFRCSWNVKHIREYHQHPTHRLCTSPVSSQRLGHSKCDTSSQLISLVLLPASLALLGFEIRLRQPISIAKRKVLLVSPLRRLAYRAVDRGAFVISRYRYLPPRKRAMARFRIYSKSRQRLKAAYSLLPTQFYVDTALLQSTLLCNHLIQSNGPDVQYTFELGI